MRLGLSTSAPAASGPLLLREVGAPLRVAPSRDVALRVLTARYGAVDAAFATRGLAPFQTEAAVRARAIIARRGGVLIADSVGLGKTHVALALLEELTGDGRRALVVGPAALRAHWLAAANGFVRFDWMSYATLSRVHEPRPAYDVVVFDEAHALRNPRTRRYRAACTLARGTRVVLLSATPVNNSIHDLYHLLRLFCDDRSFLDVGVPSLRGAFEQAEDALLLGSAPSLQPVLRAAVIRRTRSALRRRARPDHGQGIALRFPRLDAVRPVRYALETRPGTMASPPHREDDAALDEIGRRLVELGFPAHRVCVARGGDPSLALLRFGLLKRLESSVAALDASLVAYQGMLDRCLSGLAAGFLVGAQDVDTRRDPAAQLTLDALVLRGLPRDFDRDAYERALRSELRGVASTRALLGSACTHDGKLRELIDLLNGELCGRRILLFTQYRDTAAYLHRHLAGRFRCARIDGTVAMLGTSRVHRDSVIRRFAPRANGAPTPRPHERVDVLVATDVLSEGLNLQDADVVLSYDLPWNPIRLVQRLGRIDRIGSSHARVSCYHFVPGSLERYLGLLHRLARKTSAIEGSIGGDVPALHATILRSLGRGDPGTLERIEAADGATFDADERLLGRLCAEDAESVASASELERVVPFARVRGFDRPSCALVAASVGARFEWAVVMDGRAVDDDALCARIVEAALDSDAGRSSSGGGAGVSGTAPGLRAQALEAIAIARAVFARRAAFRAAAPVLPSGSGVARHGRALLTAARALPGGPDGPTCARIEAALDRLARLPADVEPPRVEHPTTLAELLASIEALPAASGREAHGSVHEVRLLGVIVAGPEQR